MERGGTFEATGKSFGNHSIGKRKRPADWLVGLSVLSEFAKRAGNVTLPCSYRSTVSSRNSVSFANESLIAKRQKEIATKEGLFHKQFLGS